MIRCSVESCDSNLNSNLRAQVSFFDFPQWEDSERFLKWAEALGKPPEHFKEKDAYICSKHFSPEDLIPESLPENLSYGDFKFRLRLSENAVPSQNLLENKDSIPILIKTNIKRESPLLVSCSVDVNFIKKEIKDEPLDEEDIKYVPEKCNTTTSMTFKQETATEGVIKKEPLESIIDIKEPSLLIDITNEPKNNMKNTQQSKQNIQSNSSGEQREKKYKCKKCGQVFNWINQVRRHKRRMHGSVKCNICFKLLTNEGSMKLHKTVKHNIHFIFNCHLCNEAFKKSRELLQHLKMHKCIEKLQCFKCKKKFSTDAEIESKKCVDCDILLKCKDCGKTFFSELILTSRISKLRMKKKMDNKKHTCNICIKKSEKSHSASDP